MMIQATIQKSRTHALRGYLSSLSSSSSSSSYRCSRAITTTKRGVALWKNHGGRSNHAIPSLLISNNDNFFYPLPLPQLHTQQQQQRGFHHQHENEEPRLRKHGRPLSIQHNKDIRRMGLQHEWRELLQFYDDHAQTFDSLNYATLLVFLRQLPLHDRRLLVQDPRFESFLHMLQRTVEIKGMEWLKTDACGLILHALGKMELGRHSHVQALLQHLNDVDTSNQLMRGVTKPVHVATMAWGLARVEQPQHALWSGIASKGEWLVEQGKPFEVANTSWALAKMDQPAPQFFDAMDQAATLLIQNGKPQEVANMAWALGTAGHHAPNFFAQLEHRADWLVQQGKPQEIANALWAFGKLGHAAPNLIRHLDERAEWFFQNCKAQEFSNSIWACANLNIRPPQLLALVEQEAPRIFATSIPQHVAMLAWSLATFDHPAPAFFDLVDRNARHLFAAGETQTIVMIARAAAVLNSTSIQGYRSFEQTAFNPSLAGVITPPLLPTFLGGIEQNANAIFAKCTPQGMSNLAWAFASQRIYSKPIYDALENNLDVFFEKGTTQAIANAAWVLSLWDKPMDAFLDRLSQEAPKMASGDDTQELTQAVYNICFSLVMLGVVQKHEQMFRQLFDRALKSNPNVIDSDAARMFVQIVILARSQGIDTSLPVWIQEKVESSDESVSLNHMHMSTLLNEIGFVHDVEVSPWLKAEDAPFPICSHLFAMDCASRERKIAIEYDGPHHFMFEGSQAQKATRLGGRSSAKHRFLESLGWSVVNVSYLEWADAKGQAEKRALLTDKLNSLKKPAE